MHNTCNLVLFSCPPGRRIHCREAGRITVATFYRVRRLDESGEFQDLPGGSRASLDAAIAACQLYADKSGQRAHVIDHDGKVKFDSKFTPPNHHS